MPKKMAEKERVEDETIVGAWKRRLWAKLPWFQLDDQSKRWVEEVLMCIRKAKSGAAQ